MEKRENERERAPRWARCVCAVGAYKYHPTDVTTTAAATAIRHKKIMKICYRLKFTTTNFSHTQPSALPPFVISSADCPQLYTEYAAYLANATNSREHLHRIIINLSEVYYLPFMLLVK